MTEEAKQAHDLLSASWRPSWVDPQSKDESFNSRRETHWGEGPAKTQAEIGVTWPQARNHLEPPAAGPDEQGPFSRVFGQVFFFSSLLFPFLS